MVVGKQFTVQTSIGIWVFFSSLFVQTVPVYHWLKIGRNSCSVKSRHPMEFGEAAWVWPKKGFFSSFTILRRLLKYCAGSAASANQHSSIDFNGVWLTDTNSRSSPLLRSELSPNVPNRYSSGSFHFVPQFLPSFRRKKEHLWIGVSTTS